MQFTFPLFSLCRYSAKMSKAPRRVIQGLLRLRFDHNLVSPSDGVSYSSIRDPLVRNFSSFVSNRTLPFQSKLPSHSAPAKGILSQIYYDPLATAGNFSFRVKDFQFLKMNQSCSALGLRFFSSNARNYGAEISGNVTKKVRSAVSRYRGAVGLQFDAFLRNNYLFLLGAGGVLVCALLWRIMFGIASTFVGISEGMAKYGFLAFSSAIVAFAGLYLRSRFTINPDKVYRMAMRKLNTSAGILEVMGAPLSGSDLRAYVMSGGGFTLKNFKPNLRSKRCFLIFPIRGSERKGLVSVEIRKKKGQYDMKLLAVDIPMGSGPEQRMFLIGDEDEYKIGGGLISELRDPVVKAMTATKEFENIDELEEEEDARRESEEAERKRREEIEKMERDG